jgi:hypothetical protein
VAGFKIFSCGIEACVLLTCVQADVFCDESWVVEDDRWRGIVAVEREGEYLLHAQPPALGDGIKKNGNETNSNSRLPVILW